jgi:hypothetical protein
MTRTIRDAEINWVIAGLRMLQNEIVNRTLHDELREIVTAADGALPDSKAIDALCTRLNMGDGMRLYLIHAYRQRDGDAGIDDIVSLDWFVSAETPEQAVRLWREHLVKNDCLDPEEASQQPPIGILEPPKPADTAWVHDPRHWSAVMVRGSKA